MLAEDFTIGQLGGRHEMATPSSIIEKEDDRLSRHLNPWSAPNARLLDCPLRALGLQAHHASEQAVTLHEFGRAPLLGHPVPIEHHHIVSRHYGTHAVSESDCGVWHHLTA